MPISPQTKIDDLIRRYPFLLDFLPSLSPKFEKLKNPILRRTIGKVATLNQVASFADYPLERLMAEIAGGRRPVWDKRRETGREQAPLGLGMIADTDPFVFC